LDPLDPDLASEAMGINNLGMIVGSAQARDAAGNAVDHAVAWDAGTRQIVSDFGTLSSLIPVAFTDLNTKAMAVNLGGWQQLCETLL
jgi:hypothetical protein